MEDKVNAITNALAPKNVSELKCYLGMINYYQTFLPTLPCVLTPLQKLLRREVHWHKEQQLNSLCLLCGNRVVIPLTIRARVVQTLHETHSETCRMKSLAKSNVWWPKMDADLKQTLRQCISCQESRKSPSEAPLQLIKPGFDSI